MRGTRPLLQPKPHSKRREMSKTAIFLVCLCLIATGCKLDNIITDQNGKAYKLVVLDESVELESGGKAFYLAVKEMK